MLLSFFYYLKLIIWAFKIFDTLEGVFAGVAAVNIILVLFVDEHCYNKDWKVVQKKYEKVAAANVNA